MSLKEKVINLLKQPINEQLEYRYPLPPERVLAKIISSFANTDGGYLIIGFSKEIGLMGLSADFYSREIIQKAIKLLSSLPKTQVDNITIKGKNIFVISVDKSNENIFLDNKKYIRLGSETKEDNPNQKSISTKEYDKTYVIIISLENYYPRETDEMPSVKYANNDANLFKETLIQHMNVKEEDIRIFMNEGATRSSLKFDLTGIFDALTERDRLIFYYAGHGFHNGESNYITDYDTHRKHIIESSISLREVLLDPFSKSKGQSLMVFIDACATNIQDKNSRNVLSNIDYNDLFKVVQNNNLYTAIFFSCQAGQSSYSCDKLKHGIWTYHLHKALSGGEPTLITNKQFISDRKLVDYLTTTVYKYTKDNLGYTQSPKAILDADSEFILLETSS